MPLLLTILSVLAAWAFLAVLVVGLFLILKPLESIRGNLEKITMGVRAIEQQTRPLGVRVDTVTDTLIDADDTVGAVARRFSEVDRDLDAAAPALRRRLQS